MEQPDPLESVWLPKQPTALAPDGSEIRELVRSGAASLAHCTLAPGAVSSAVKHQTIEELWYVLGGRGEIWRKSTEREELLEAAPGCSIRIAPGVSFQFRTNGEEPFEVLIATIPAWPGSHEAVRVDGRWPPRLP
jgi:mannose-6-phosphate isomerase-like protein (cupin superfamily)